MNLRAAAGEVAHDVRLGARSLAAHPGYAAAIVLTLALATGATTAIFGIVNSVLLRPLPFRDPDRLVLIRGDHPLTAAIDPIDLQQFRDHSTTVESFASYYPQTRHLQGPSGPERIAAFMAERELFPLLGVSAA